MPAPKQKHKPKQKLMWQIFPSYLIIIIAALIFVAAFTLYSMKELYLGYVISELKQDSYLVEKVVFDDLVATDYENLQKRCFEMGAFLNSRVTISDTAGKIICDSHTDPIDMELQDNKPEMIQAFTGKTGIATHFNESLQKNITYVARPIFQHNKILAIIRMAMTTKDLNNTLNSLIWRVFFSIIATILFATLLVYVSAQRIVGPLNIIRKESLKIAFGNPDVNIPEFDTDEIDILGETISGISKILDIRIQKHIKHQEEFEVILSSFNESIIVFDAFNKVMSINDPAKRELNISLSDPIEWVTKTFSQNTEIEDLIQKCIQANKALTEQVSITLKDVLYKLQVTIKPLSNNKSEIIGSLMMIHTNN